MVDPLIAASARVAAPAAACPGALTRPGAAAAWHGAWRGRRGGGPHTLRRLGLRAPLHVIGPDPRITAPRAHDTVVHDAVACAAAVAAAGPAPAREER